MEGSGGGARRDGGVLPLQPRRVRDQQPRGRGGGDVSVARLCWVHAHHQEHQDSDLDELVQQTDFGLPAGGCRGGHPRQHALHHPGQGSGSTTTIASTDTSEQKS